MRRLLPAGRLWAMRGGAADTGGSAANATVEHARAPFWLRVSGCLLVGACSPPASDPPRVEAAEQWTASVVAEYGSIDGSEPAELFGGMVTALLLGESGVLAVDHQSRELRWFSPGQPPRVGGGVGNGPGEFRAIGNAAVGADSVIHLTGVSSISRFDEAGEFLGRRELDFGALSSRLPEGLVRGQHRVLPDGSLLMEATWGGLAEVPDSLLDRPVDTEGIVRYRSRFLISDADLGAGVWIAEVAGAEQLDGSFDVPFRLIPYYRSSAVLGGGDPMHYFIIDSGEARIRVLDESGAQVAEARYPHSAAMVDDSDRMRWLAGFLADNPRIRDRREDVVRGWNAADLPREAPLFKDPFVDREGRLWLAKVSLDDEPVRYDVFSARGEHLAWLDIPLDNFRGTHARDGRLVGITTDGLGVVKVVVLAVGPAGQFIDASDSSQTDN